MAVCVLRLVSTADSKTERLRLQLTAPNSRHCITHMYLIQPLLTSLPLQSNKRHTRIVAAASNQRNAVRNIYFLPEISLRSGVESRILYEGVGLLSMHSSILPS